MNIPASPPPYTGPALLHVGFIKTGTTTLQETVFSNTAAGFELIGGEDNRALLVSWFRARNDYQFDIVQLRSEIEELERPAREKGLVPVWSEETLLGDPLVTDYCGPEVLWRLSQLKLNVKFLITIRRQESFALSAYREGLRFGRYPLTDFLGTGAEDLSMRPILRPEFLEYDKVIEAYQTAFGKENCCVLPLEKLQKSPESYLNSLCRFLDLPTPPLLDDGPRNVGRGGTALKLGRLLNGFYVVSPLTFEPSFARKLADRLLTITDHVAPARLDKVIESAWRAQISTRYAGLFAPSNRRLETLTGLTLSKYGYQ
jgi:hypothetical protein